VRVTANGKPYDVDQSITVGEFVRKRGLDPQLIVVEHNGEALERSRYDRVRLTEGDRLEVVRAVAGG
jgi:thiamine biosynthesis protein ThiS